DKPLEQWKSTDQIRLTQTRQLFYYNDTVGGFSGSPVYYNRSIGSPYCVRYCTMAIHAYGLHGSAPHTVYNHGTRIVEPVFNNLRAWRDASWDPHAAGRDAALPLVRYCLIVRV